jgi:hypothetical protein
MIDINIFIVIPAQAGIQANGKIRLFTKPSTLKSGINSNFLDLTTAANYTENFEEVDY